MFKRIIKSIVEPKQFEVGSYYKDLTNKTWFCICNKEDYSVLSDKDYDTQSVRKIDRMFFKSNNKGE